MRLTPPKKSVWYLCLILWIIGIILVLVDLANVAAGDFALYGALVLALSGILSLLSTALKGF